MQLLDAPALPAYDGVVAAEEDLAVSKATLRYERVLRDGALQRYESARVAYEAACVARERRRLVQESHDFTQTHLTRATEHIRTILNRSCPATGEGGVRETTVSAAALLVSSAHYSTAERGLQALVAQEARYQSLRRSPPPTNAQESSRAAARAYRTSPLPCSTSGNSREIELCAGVPTAAPSTRPLLYFAATQLTHTLLLQNGRHSLFSQIACTQRLLPARSDKTESPSALSHVVDVARCREEVEEARAAFADATAMQQGATARLDELHQWLGRRVPVHAQLGIYVDAGAAGAVQRQIASELDAGRVTLLRLLCESGPEAFDEEGRLRLHP